MAYAMLRLTTLLAKELHLKMKAILSNVAAMMENHALLLSHAEKVAQHTMKQLKSV